MTQKLTSFDKVVGHKNLITFLQRRVLEDNVGNVIIFHGEPGIGKSSIAKILAVEVACRFAADDLKQAYTQAVILNNQSTDSIKIFNMSEIQEKEEEIQKVKAELTVGFSSTGRKVLILDEAHNIKAKAQDAILTELEYLQKGVYVFICTTEINALRDALKSRSKATYHLSNLSSVEARQVIQREIARRRLTFDISQQVIEALICEWANNQPRQMCNLLDNFLDGSLVRSRDLEVFINVSTAASIIELLKYLYGSMVLGVAFLESIKYDESFATMLIEVCKVALGHTSNSISRQDTLYIKTFMQDKDPVNILKFTAEVTGLPDLRKRKVISAFLKSHIDYERVTKPNIGMSDLAKAKDFKVFSENVEATQVNEFIETKIAVPSLDELFSVSDRIGG